MNKTNPEKEITNEIKLKSQMNKYVKYAIFKIDSEMKVENIFGIVEDDTFCPVINETINGSTMSCEAFNITKGDKISDDIIKFNNGTLFLYKVYYFHSKPAYDITIKNANDQFRTERTTVKFKGRITHVILNNSDHYIISDSKCHKTDVYDRKRGNEIAIYKIIFDCDNNILKVTPNEQVLTYSEFYPLIAKLQYKYFTNLN